MEFELSNEYIELIKLLKLIGIAETGGHAKELVDEGIVLVNNETELRKRKKLVVGDVVECEGETITIVAATS
tara:strand:- start:1393 stop:1608 length:216 start_codon:yes stop_codon:yes gene_type:complete